MALTDEQRAMFHRPPSFYTRDFAASNAESMPLVPMTEIEHNAMRLSAELAQEIHAVIVQDESTTETSTVDEDWREACVHLHALQAMIMRNIAARCYPQLYRQLGRSVQR